jgi:Flp pilus assembly pilin Flp
MALIVRLIQNDGGGTAIEYGFIAGVLSIVAAAIWNVLGFQLTVLSAQIATYLGFSGVIVAG